jgi:lipoprotein-releasing system permease protein
LNIAGINLNLSFYIAKRLSTGKHTGTSSLIIRIAVAGVGLSVAIMIISQAIVKGYQLEIKNKITGFSTHIQISKLDLNNSLETIPIMTDTIMERMILKTPGVQSIQRFATKPGIIKTSDEFEGIVLKGIDNHYNWNFLKHYLVEGDTLHFDSAVSNNLLVSRKLASTLKLKLHDRVTVYFVQDPPRARRFNVTGIYDTGFDEMDKLYVFADMRQVQKLNNWFEGAITGYEIYVDDFTQVEKRVNDIVAYVPYNEKVQSSRDLYPELFDWLGLLDLNVIVIIILMVVVACINMMTALLILIVERSNMIGILKALGMNNAGIGRIFLNMAAFLMLSGLFLGNLIGIGLCLSQQYGGWLKLPQESYFISQVPIRMETMDILLINIGSAVFCLLILMLPVRFVNRILPARVIRFE